MAIHIPYTYGTKYAYRTEHGQIAYIIVAVDGKSTVWAAQSMRYGKGFAANAVSR